MPRPRADFRAVHAEAARLEPRVAGSVRRALEKLRDAVSINSLALALAAKDVKRAMALFPAAQAKEALSPAGRIVRDAVLRGGRLGAALLSQARVIK